MPAVQRIAELVFESFPNASIELGSDPRHDKRGRFDLGAAARDLHWDAQVDIERGVRTHIEWLSANRPNA